MTEEQEKELLTRLKMLDWQLYFVLCVLLFCGFLVFVIFVRLARLG